MRLFEMFGNLDDDDLFLLNLLLEAEESEDDDDDCEFCANCEVDDDDDDTTGDAMFKFEDISDSIHRLSAELDNLVNFLEKIKSANDAVLKTISIAFPQRTPSDFHVSDEVYDKFLTAVEKGQNATVVYSTIFDDGSSGGVFVSVESNGTVTAGALYQDAEGNRYMFDDMEQGFMLVTPAVPECHHTHDKKEEKKHSHHRHAHHRSHRHHSSGGKR